MLKRAGGRRRSWGLNGDRLLTEFQYTHANHYCTSVCLAGRPVCVPPQLPGALEPSFNMLDCPAERGRRPLICGVLSNFLNMKINKVKRK